MQEALQLLSSPRRVALAGGTTLNADREPSDLEAVDLQALGLGSIAVDHGARVRMGATATLDSLRRCDLLPASLRELARAEQPSTLRTLATVGGLVARASAESLLLAALLAHDARVELAGPARGLAEMMASSERGLAEMMASSERGLAEMMASSERGLAEMMASGLPAGSLITAVTIDPAGHTAVARTGRTPADVPIVAAYGRRAEGFVTLALTGVAEHPVMVDVSDPVRSLDPVGDFRGSRQYRLDLARTLTARVMEELRR